MRRHVRIETFDVITGMMRCQWVCNRVVRDGRQRVRDLLSGAGLSGVTHFAVGTSGSDTVDGQDGLFNEVFRDVLTQSISGDRHVLVKGVLGISHANGHTIREVGVFTADNVLYARAVFVEPVEKTTSVTVLVSWTLGMEAG